MDGRILQWVQVNVPYRMLSEELLARILELGLNPEIGFDASVLDGTPPGEFKRVAQAFRERGLRVTCHAPFMDLSAGSPDPAVRRLTRRRLEQTLKAVSAFRPVTVVCHTGWDHRRYNELRESWLEQGLRIWTWFAGALRDEGARMMMENVYERTPEELLDCVVPLREAGVGVCLDTGHLTAFGDAPLSHWIQTLGPDIGQLHLHDNRGDADEHLAPGKGTVDFPLLFDRLVAILPQPPVVTLEPHREEALWEGLDYLDGLWPKAWEDLSR